MNSCTCHHHRSVQLPRGWTATRSILGRAVIFTGCILVVGCRPDDQIDSYTVPVLHQPAASPTATETGEPTDRMLAAILPQGGQAWFFKVVGPIPAIDRQAQAIDDFFAGLRLADDQSKPAWKLPDGWTEQDGTGMRAATISIPAGDQPLELTVVVLPWTGRPDDVLSNVNRWRGQLQLPAIGAQGLAECTRELSTNGTTMTIVDLQGRMQETGMAAPFAGGRSPATPPSAVPSEPALTTSSELPQFDVPKEWQELSAAPPRKAAFRVADGPQEALVTVIDFPAAAGPMIADPLENLNRWRREVGLPEITNAGLADATESIVVHGQPASYFEVVPDSQDAAESKIERATLAVMLPQGGKIWFFKLNGDRAVVETQRKEFRAFIDSVRFPDDEGTDDVN